MVRGKRSQFDAKFNSGTAWPKTRIAAPHPQNDRGHPAGRPPTIWPVPAFAVSEAVGPRAIAYDCNTRARRVTRSFVCSDCASEKSQGIVTLHSFGWLVWNGRASEEAEARTINTDATRTRSNMQDSIERGSCPSTRSHRINWAKLGLKPCNYGTFTAGMGKVGKGVKLVLLAASATNTTASTARTRKIMAHMGGQFKKVLCPIL